MSTGYPSTHGCPVVCKILLRVHVLAKKKQKKKKNDNDNTLYNHMSQVVGGSFQCSSEVARIGCAVIAQPIDVFIS